MGHDSRLENWPESFRNHSRIKHGSAGKRQYQSITGDRKVGNKAIIRAFKITARHVGQSMVIRLGSRSTSRLAPALSSMPVHS